MYFSSRQLLVQDTDNFIMCTDIYEAEIIINMHMKSRRSICFRIRRKSWRRLLSVYINLWRQIMDVTISIRSIGHHWQNTSIEKHFFNYILKIRTILFRIYRKPRKNVFSIRTHNNGCNIFKSTTNNSMLSVSDLSLAYS